MTLSTMASFCGEHLESMVLQDPSGIAQHDLKLGELWNKELAGDVALPGLDDMPDNSMQNVVRHVTDNPLLSLREVVGLRNPDMRPHLEAAKRKGIKVGLLVLGRPRSSTRTPTRGSPSPRGCSTSSRRSPTPTTSIRT